MSKLVKIPTLKSGQDKEAADKLKELFADAQNGLRRVVALGLFCYEIKAQLKHGQFKPWLAKNCEEISYRSLASHMQLTASVLEKCKTSITAFQQKCKALHFSTGGELLLLPEAKIPAEAKPLREKICDLIDGKSANQLFFEFKQADDDDEKPKHGRLKGQGGASKEQRSKAKALEEQEQITADELSAQDFCKWIDEVCEIGRLPKIPDATWKKLFERQKLLGDFMRGVNESRGGKQ